MKTILITGAGGLIGRHVAAAFAARGYDCIGTTRKNGSALSAGVRPAVCDLLSPDDVRDTVKTHTPDAVIHCAGVIPPRPGRAAHDAPKPDYIINTRMTRHLVDALNGMPGRKPAFLLASSVAVYGAPARDGGFVREDDPPRPASHYAQSKRACETLVNEAYDGPSTVLRIANVPERDAFLAAMIATGTAHFYGDAPYIRDHIAPEAAAEAFMRAAQALWTKNDTAARLVLNSGGGRGLSFSDLADAVERATGRPLARESHSARPGDVVRLVCDMTRMRDALGWTPAPLSADECARRALAEARL